MANPSRLERRRPWLVLFGLLLTAACGKDPAAEGEDGGSDTEGGAMPSFEKDVQPIFTDNCLGPTQMECHVDGGDADPLLAEGDAHSQIVGEAAKAPTLENFSMNYVEPNEPENSFLLHKLRGTHVDLFENAENAGERMPCDEIEKVGNEIRCVESVIQLPDDELQMIEDWILAGAPP